MHEVRISSLGVKQPSLKDSAGRQKNVDVRRRNVSDTLQLITVTSQV